MSHDIEFPSSRYNGVENYFPKLFKRKQRYSEFMNESADSHKIHLSVNWFDAVGTSELKLQSGKELERLLLTMRFTRLHLPGVFIQHVTLLT